MEGLLAMDPVKRNLAVSPDVNRDIVQLQGTDNELGSQCSHEPQVRWSWAFEWSNMCFRNDKQRLLLKLKKGYSIICLDTSIGKQVKQHVVVLICECEVASIDVQ